jgi:hypothetical protein
MDLKTLLQTVNQVPAQQEWKQPESGEVNLFNSALVGVKVSSAPVEDIKEVLRLVMVKIGLRAQNWPTDEEKFVLIEHVIKNFGGHTCEEIKLAFDMAIQGMLKFEEDQSVNCYENFSCLYFSNIMNAYREWAKESYKLIEKNIKPGKQKIYSDEEILNGRRQEIETCFQAMKQGYYPIIHVYFDQVLRDDGLLKEGETALEFLNKHLNAETENIYVKS